jgi:hypothetical protein
MRILVLGGDGYLGRPTAIEPAVRRRETSTELALSK